MQYFRQRIFVLRAFEHMNGGTLQQAFCPILQWREGGVGVVLGKDGGVKKRGFVQKGLGHTKAYVRVLDRRGDKWCLRLDELLGCEQGNIL